MFQTFKQYALVQFPMGQTLPRGLKITNRQNMLPLLHTWKSTVTLQTL